MNRPIRTILIIVTLAIITGCTQGPPTYENDYLGMPLKQLFSSHAGAEKVRSVPDDNGVEIVEYSLPAEGNVKQASYFFQNDLLIGMVIIFGEGADFDYLANRLALKNGKPTQIKTVDETSGAHWRRADAYIMLLKGIKGTQVKMPIGKTDEIRPEEIILIIGKTPKE